MTERIYFDFDKSVLKLEAQALLKKKAEWLKANPNSKLLIEGNCDERGTAEYNLALGERRAAAAQSYIVALGIPASRIKTVSYGKEFPFDPGHDEAAWAKNRRAHFVITGK
jgi:peptidoglycan-associated lipoprotein